MSSCLQHVSAGSRRLDRDGGRKAMMKESSEDHAGAVLSIATDVPVRYRYTERNVAGEQFDLGPTHCYSYSSVIVTAAAATATQ